MVRVVAFALAVVYVGTSAALPVWPEQEHGCSEPHTATYANQRDLERTFTHYIHGETATLSRFAFDVANWIKVTVLPIVRVVCVVHTPARYGLLRCVWGVRMRIWTCRIPHLTSRSARL